MATGPKIPTDPLELLSPSDDVVPPLLTNIWGPLIGGSLGFVGVIVGNYGTKRPVMSGIQKHIIFTVIGVFVGKYLEDMRRDYFAERDAVFRHYVSLHPEDFPPFQRKKIGDIIEDWYPSR